MKTFPRTTFVGSFVLGLLLTACASGGNNAGIAVSDAWVRPAPVIGRASAAYMLITNGGVADDRLLSITAAVADIAELHETKTEGGMMVMSPVNGITVPANGQAELKPGGYHVMLIGLTRELKVGDTLTLTLKFENAGELTVTAEVREG